MVIFPLKKEWYNQIKSGKKTVEYREVKPYWIKRISLWLYDTGQKDKETVNPINTSNSKFDDFFNSDIHLHEMLKTPEKTKIGELLKYAFEAGYKQGIEVKE